jgi:hypothetical protein
MVMAPVLKHGWAVFKMEQPLGAATSYLLNQREIEDLDLLSCELAVIELEELG